MNYENMSDFEINKAVAEYYFDKDTDIETIEGLSKRGYVRINKNGVFISDFAPCNNPSHSWPVMEKSDIGFHPVGWHEDGSKTWQAFWSADQLIIECESTNSLRAAMIVYLLLQQDTE
jgi:hypothetical protein